MGKTITVEGKLLLRQLKKDLKNLNVEEMT